jgi:exonuclease III
MFLCVLILLSGDVHMNPGPASAKFNMCTLNIRSLTNPIHYTALSDLADTYNIDLFALTETWISPNTTSAELFDATPPGFSLISNPRPVSTSKISSIVGGSTAFLIRHPYSLLSSPSYSFSSFEISNVTLKLPEGKLSVFNIYRPPTSLSKSRNKSSFSHFLEDFQSFISNVATLPHDFIITGDFNIHVDDFSDSHTQQFMSLLSLANLTQHVSFPTHRHLHTLDLVITTVDSLLSPVITRTVNSPSDHFPVFSSLNITPPKPSPLSKHSFRPIKSINIHSFIRDILSSTLITHPPSNLSDLVDCYNSTLSSLLNKHAPVITKTLRLKPV